jgi:heme exporter protein A
LSAAAHCLEVDRVHVWRGDRHVLKGTSFRLEGGELLHVWGPNGTGKTTLLRVVCGLLRPEQGSVRWLGRAINSIAADYQAALAYASHETALKSDLTALENLRFTVGMKRAVGSAELREMLEKAGVGACADLPARVLSAGQRRRVAIARVLALRASLWLLDEPYTNLDAHGAAFMSAMLDAHVDQGGCAVVVAHHDLALGCRVRRLELGA